MDVEVAIETRARLGEGPRWDAAARRLLWVDIEGRALHLFDPQRGADRAVPLPDRVGAAAPTSDPETVVVALADRVATVSLGGGSLRTLTSIPHGADMRLNDGAVGPDGAFWVGSMALDERPGAAALYRFAPTGLERVLDGVSLSNGIGWTPDGRRMFYVDSPTQRVDVVPFDPETGAIGERAPFVEIEPSAGIPDGLAVDDEGRVWVALYGGGAVRRYGLDGRLEETLELPVSRPTACAFGGDDGRSLFITSACRADEPLAGSVFVARSDVGGPPARPFVLG